MTRIVKLDRDDPPHEFEFDLSFHFRRSLMLAVYRCGQVRGWRIKGGAGG